MTGRSRSGLRGVLGGLVTSLALSGSLLAQGVTTGAVSGKITNQAGEPVASAQVVVRNTATGAQSGALSNKEGLYYVPYLQPGSGYEVTVTSLGFAENRRRGVGVSLGRNTRIDFQMSQQAVEIAGIEVTGARSATFSPSHTGASTMVDSSTLQSLPTLTRNFTDFAAISPHVVVTAGSPSIGGANNRFNNIQIDGAVNNDVFGLGSSGVPGDNVNAKPISIEAIKEYQVLIAPFDVRQAGFTGGLINAVTRSGGNEFHGSVFGNYRNKGLVGDLTVDGAPITVGDFTKSVAGFSLSGPIVKDRIHFFTANEFTFNKNPMAYGIASPADAIGLAPDSIRRFVDILKTRYNVDPGDPAAVTQENPSQNIFARLDFELGKSRLTVRDNYVHGTNQYGVSRGGSYYALTSNGIDYKSTSNSAVVEFFTNISDRWHNEVLLNYETIREPRNPMAAFPDIQVTNYSVVNGTSVKRTLEAGAEYYSQDNLLNQDIAQFTDNLTGIFGAHRLTIGTSNQRLQFDNHFFPGALGRYQFNSLADFENGKIYSYSRSLMQPGVTSVAANWATYQLGGYVQDEWTVSPQLNVIAGVRLDVPIISDKPRVNDTFLAASGMNTSTVPTGNMLWSPRVGFNYRAGDAHVTQVRGGVGIFTGRPPYVWLSNLYTNTGKEQMQLYCSSSAGAVINLSAPPTSCANGTVAQPGATQINVFDKGFKFPQDLKIDLAVDRQLPLGFTGTLEGLYTKAVNAVFYKEANLVGAQGQSNPADGIGNRPIYGTPTAAGYNATRKWNGFYQVVEGTNTGNAHSYSASIDLKRSFGRLFDFQGAYTYARSYDTQSLTSSIATSNLGYNPIEGDFYSPTVRPSIWDRPHKLSVSGTLHLLPQFGGTELSAIYVGQSGELYNYTYDQYNADINGDGYPDNAHGLGGRANDIIYVPKSTSELVWTNPDQARLFQELMNLDSCLKANEGTIIPRNSCRTPWQNRLNVRVGQNLAYGGRKAEVFLDVFNFLNLLNSDWGHILYPSNNTITVLSTSGRQNKSATAPYVFSYYGRTQKGSDGVLHAATSFNTSTFDSRWQMQLGMRMSF